MQGLIPSDRLDYSVLVDFDTGAVLDALSVGIVVLDAQLCAVYGNAIAEETLALRIESVRGQPLTGFLKQPELFLDAVNAAFARDEAVEFRLEVTNSAASKPLRSVFSRIAPLGYRVSGPYLLLEVGCSLSMKPRRPASPIHARRTARKGS